MATEENHETSQEIERLRKIRGAHRAVVTKLGRDTCVLIKENGDKQEANLRSRLTSIRSTLNDKQTLLNALNDRILERYNENEIGKEIEKSTELTTLINDWIERIKQFKCSGSKNVVPSTQIEAPKTSTPKRPEARQNVQQAKLPFEQLETSVVSETPSSRAFCGVRLPKINLPKFNGDITKYQHFMQSFKCSVVANESLSGVNKLD